MRYRETQAGLATEKHSRIKGLYQVLYMSITNRYLVYMLQPAQVSWRFEQRFSLCSSTLVHNANYINPSAGRWDQTDFKQERGATLLEDQAASSLYLIVISDSKMSTCI